MASVNKSSWGTSDSKPPPVPPQVSHTPKSSRLPTAAEEKEMLRRYTDATRAVQLHHVANFGSDGIMASASSSLTPGPYLGGLDNNSAPAPDDELPPPWVPSPEFSQTEGMSEKERYRIAFEARERAAATVQRQSASPPPLASTPTSPPADYYTATGTPYPTINGSELSGTADGGLPPPWQPTPPATQSGLPPHLRARSPPVPPSNPAQPGQPRLLSAAEEKALIKAKYEAEEQSPSSPPVTPQRQQEYHTSPRVTPPSGMPSPTRSELPVLRDHRQVAALTSTPPRTPPPLMPRPPASYIQETADEDARLQDELANGKLSPSGTTTAMAAAPASAVAADAGGATSLDNHNDNDDDDGGGDGDDDDDDDDDTFGLLRPTSPFTIGWESIGARTSGAGAKASPNGLGSLSPPPLPPKVPLEY
ncbi:hypothetical protein BJV74DRAFT_500399 [Russula compacta]|nr:hypothetical protein BJV74DRAFT_500399 [Russula compacta]